MQRKASILTTLFLLALWLGCGKDPELLTDAELGLTPQQAHGRQIYKRHCAICHSAYASKGSKGPTMKGLYKKQYLPSGLLASDQFVEHTIVRGRNMMPGSGNVLSQQDLADLVGYLHTL